MSCVKRQYTIAEDTLGNIRSFLFKRILTSRIDPDDLIFPRVATRVGPKFQANVGNSPIADTTAPLGTIVIEGLSSWINHPFVGADERGGPSTVEAMSLVNQMSEEEGEILLLCVM
jgi:hypothetical protein